jgi:hippurate hydrolase
MSVAGSGVALYTPGMALGVLLLLAAASVDTATDAQLDSLLGLYEQLHRNPELSYYEEKTAARLIAELEPLGFDVTPDVGGHGFVAVMRNGAGPTVLLRTDLDGLPVVEQTGRGYASDIRTKDDQGRDVGVMHACGHDVHMSSFVGVARNLSKLKDQWRGTLVMIGQPAEERGAGARLMLADGLYEKFPRPDYALALHVAADLPVGTVGYTSGYALANVDSVDITVKGVGGHGAWPHKTKDPVVLAAQIVLALQTIVSREVSPLDSAVVTVGSIHGGDKHNVIGQEVKLQLTVRSYSDETRRMILESIRRITLNTARAFGVPADREPVVTVAEEEFTPSTYNTPELVERLLPVWRKTLGEKNVIKTEPVMGGEDFSRYGRTEPKVPITIFWVGTIDQARYGQGGLPPLHSPLFWPDARPAIRTGVRAMTASALELLGKP